jgi:hypothetical protein
VVGGEAPTITMPDILRQLRIAPGVSAAGGPPQEGGGAQGLVPELAGLGSSIAGLFGGAGGKQSGAQKFFQGFGEAGLMGGFLHLFGDKTGSEISNIFGKVSKFIPFLQEGGLVHETGAAIVHKGEVVANAHMMRQLGESTTHMTGADIFRMVAGLSASSDLHRTQTREINEQLAKSNAAAQGGTHVHMDGANFYGTPGPTFISGMMNQVVRDLRMSSRTWAFNPTGQ